MATFLGSSSKLKVEDVNEDEIEAAKIIYLEGYLFDPRSSGFYYSSRICKKHNTKVSFTLSDAFCVEKQV